LSREAAELTFLTVRLRPRPPPPPGPLSLSPRSPSPDRRPAFQKPGAAGTALGSGLSPAEARNPVPWSVRSRAPARAGSASAGGRGVARGAAALNFGAGLCVQGFWYSSVPPLPAVSVRTLATVQKQMTLLRTEAQARSCLPLHHTPAPLICVLLPRGHLIL